jgi:excisionase family DNA binding protein
MKNEKSNVAGMPISESCLWNYADCGRFLRRSVNTLRRDVMYHKIPFIRVGRSIRFSPEAIRAYLAANTIEAR